MDKILLKITGTQLVDRQKDRIELTTTGTIRDDGTAFVIRYTEQQEPPFAPVKVTVRIQKDESAVEMTRSGEYGSCLMIEIAKRNLCHYGTQAGNMLMGIYGREIEARIESGSGSFFFAYDIDFNGAVASKNTVDMVFTKNKVH